MIVNSEKETAAFAQKVFSILKGGEAIGLIGALGAGKTAFVRYFAQAAGVAVGEVSSPSFVLGHEYLATHLTIDHWDIYRLMEEPDELWEPPACNTIRIIEWADRSQDLLERLDLTITFDFVDLKSKPQARQISLGGRLAEKVESIS